MTDDDDHSMKDAHEAATDSIRQKIKNLTGRAIIRGSFELLDLQTEQLQSLRDAQPQRVHAGENVGWAESELYRYNISMAGSPIFLDLACEPEVFYARSGYPELFQHVARKWSEKKFRVILQGNAGTGKSWFQVYALKQLLDDQERKFDVIIRQVDTTLYVLDLDEATVYTWDVATDHVKLISTRMKRTLYFFEPGGDPTMRPLEVFIPSLSTLSPFEGRIKEYRKRFCTLAYFWPWSFWEMWAIVCNSDISMDLDEFQKRYNRFGGILRNVLGEQTDADEQLTARLKEISVDVLTSIALNIDRQAEGNNVSGYLVCYDNRFIEQNRFSTKNLEYTSLEVEEEVASRLQTKPLKDKMQAILKRLNSEILDISGKMLEAVAMELLSQGRAYSWKSREVGTVNWVPFATRKRNIKRTYTLAENFNQADLTIAPTNTRFPVVDFVYSFTGNGPIVCFQCTWQSRHPFTVRALYDLRINHMKIGDDQIVNIYIVCPSKDNMLATLYASLTKDDFLQGSLDTDLQFTKAVKVPSLRLKAMWNSTNIWVLSPHTTWQAYITEWLSKHP